MDRVVNEGRGGGGRHGGRGLGCFRFLGDTAGCSAEAERDFFSIQNEGRAHPRLTLKTPAG